MTLTRRDLLPDGRPAGPEVGLITAWLHQEGWTFDRAHDRIAAMGGRLTSAKVAGGRAGAKSGAIQHIVSEAWMLWLPENQPFLLVDFACGNYTHLTVIDPARIAGRRRCPNCPWTNRSEDAVVYFATRADGLVKIGSSINPERRRTTLRARLLATEPGGRAREDQLHRLFAADRVLGEWFHPTPALLAYIEAVKEVAA